MEKKFTRAMVCSEFKSTCWKCPLHSANNPKSLACWLLDESDIQTIMDDYPYTDVKARMTFNDIETRLAAVEKKVKDEPRVSKGSVTYDLKNNCIAEFEPERIIFGDYAIDVVDKKIYDKLEAKHEADCRLISEYDLDIKRLEDKCSYLEKENRTFNVLLINKTETIGKLGYEYDKLKNEVCDLNKQINSFGGSYDKLEEKYNKLLKDYKLLSKSNNNHAKDNVELEGELEAKTNRIAALEEKLRNQRTNLASLQEKYEDACKMNKAREDVYYQNQILAESIKAKDREIGLLRSKLSTIEDYDDYDGLD